MLNKIRYISKMFMKSPTGHCPFDVKSVRQNNGTDCYERSHCLGSITGICNEPID
jgi:hypothetical protein